MSDAGIGSRRWNLYVRDMIDFCEKVTPYTNGLNQAAFVHFRPKHVQRYVD